jgi:hypothetical protein
MSDYNRKFILGELFDLLKIAGTNEEKDSKDQKENNSNTTPNTNSENTKEKKASIPFVLMELITTLAGAGIGMYISSRNNDDENLGKYLLVGSIAGAIVGIPLSYILSYFSFFDFIGKIGRNNKNQKQEKTGVKTDSVSSSDKAQAEVQVSEDKDTETTDKDTATTQNKPKKRTGYGFYVVEGVAMPTFGTLVAYFTDKFYTSHILNNDKFIEIMSDLENRLNSSVPENIGDWFSDLEGELTKFSEDHHNDALSKLVNSFKEMRKVLTSNESDTVRFTKAVRYIRILKRGINSLPDNFKSSDVINKLTNAINQYEGQIEKSILSSAESGGIKLEYNPDYISGKPALRLVETQSVSGVQNTGSGNTSEQSEATESGRTKIDQRQLELASTRLEEKPELGLESIGKELALRSRSRSRMVLGASSFAGSGLIAGVGVALACRLIKNALGRNEDPLEERK